MKQKENNKSGIFHIENVLPPEERKSPGGHYIEKSRKTELYIMKKKQDLVEEKKIQKYESSIWTKLKRFLGKYFA